MMQYIHENYTHDISLDDIACYAGISKSTVLNLFRKYLHITPHSLSDSLPAEGGCASACKNREKNRYDIR